MIGKRNQRIFYIRIITSKFADNFEISKVEISKFNCIHLYVCTISVTACAEDKDYLERTWPITPRDTTATMECDPGLEGTVPELH